jgi:hypothetical protein
MTLQVRSGERIMLLSTRNIYTTAVFAQVHLSLCTYLYAVAGAKAGAISTVLFLSVFHLLIVLFSNKYNIKKKKKRLAMVRTSYSRRTSHSHTIEHVLTVLWFVRCRLCGREARDRQKEEAQTKKEEGQEAQAV